MEHGGGYSIDMMQALRSSWVIILMAFLSVGVVWYGIQKWLYFAKNKLDSDKFMGKIKGYVVDKNYDDALKLCDKTRGSVAKVIRAGLENRRLPRDEVGRLMEVTEAEEGVNLERYLGYLGTIGNTAPFIGLLGTVLGIIKAFGDLASSAGGGPEVVMIGIAEALLATAVGLGVAIPSVILFNVYMKKVKNIRVEMDAMSKKLLVYLANYGEGTSASRRK